MPMVMNACTCSAIEASPGGMPTAIDGKSSANWPTNSVPPMAMSVRHGTGGLGRKSTGSAAIAKRSAASNSGGKSVSASRDEDEIQPPEDREQDGEDDVAGLQGRDRAERAPLCTQPRPPATMCG